MTEAKIGALLELVAAGRLSAGDALKRLRHLPFDDLGFARIDNHRSLRRGVPEVVFGDGKSAAQIVAIGRQMRKREVNLIVTRLAADKARAVECGSGEVILGADTTVVVDDIVLEKPVDASDARRMIGMLSGRSHRVLTGICLRGEGLEIVDISTTTVRFAPLTSAEIDAYVASGEPMDKAGGYAIQGLAAKFVEAIDGCYFNVMGLPVSLVYHHLKRFQY